MEFVIIPRNALDVGNQTAYNQVWLNVHISSLNCYIHHSLLIIEHLRRIRALSINGRSD